MNDSTTPAIVGSSSEGSVIVGASRQPPKPPESKSFGEALRRNLFYSPASSVFSVILLAVLAYGAYRLLMFVFVNGQWEPVQANFENFLTGNGLREERWRLVAQALSMGLGAGLLAGNVSASAKDVAEETGEPVAKTSWQELLGSYWSIILFVSLTMVAFVRTPTPWLILAGVVVLAIVGWLVAKSLPRSLRSLGWTATMLSVVLGFQMLSGTGGWAWFFTTVTLIPALTALVGRLTPARAKQFGPVLLAVAGLLSLFTLFQWSTSVGIAAVLLTGLAAFQFFTGDRIDATRLATLIVAAGVVSVINGLIGHEGIDWKDWGGFHLNLVVASCSILLAFPFGVLLALGRRSELPMVRWMCTIYIEFFRGVPLITLLLSAAFFFGFFLNTSEIPSLISRAVAAVTMFAAAYIAEIVRGGLQAVPKGQVEAGQAMGLSAAKITRLIVLPQALRAVIPAMVGQFISLFKDTSLLFIIGVGEFLRFRSITHSQGGFQTIGIAESLTFVAFGFWAFAFAMSRESQRLERRLSVGQR